MPDCVLAANGNVASAVQRDKVISVETNDDVLCDAALSDDAAPADIATSLRDELEPDVDELVSWTHTLDV